MSKLPEKIKRISDGEILILNENNKYHFLKSDDWRNKGHLIWEYSYKELIEDFNGNFEAVLE